MIYPPYHTTPTPHANPRNKPALNAIAPIPPGTDAAERTARHLRMCQELAELGMELARAAAARALRDWATPATPAASPDENPAPEPTPQAAAAKTLDPGLLFARLSRAVRQSIALEARIAADALVSHRHTHRSPNDPRREILRRALHQASAGHPDHAELRRDTDERLDHELAIDPGQHISVPELLATISEDLGIPITYDRLPDTFLFSPNRSQPQPGPDPSIPQWLPQRHSKGPEPPNPILGR